MLQNNFLHFLACGQTDVERADEGVPVIDHFEHGVQSLLRPAWIDAAFLRQLHQVAAMHLSAFAANVHLMFTARAFAEGGQNKVPVASAFGHPSDMQSFWRGHHGCETAH